MANYDRCDRCGNDDLSHSNEIQGVYIQWGNEKKRIGDFCTHCRTHLFKGMRESTRPIYGFWAKFRNKFA